MAKGSGCLCEKEHMNASYKLYITEPLFIQIIALHIVHLLRKLSLSSWFISLCFLLLTILTQAEQEHLPNKYTVSFDIMMNKFSLDLPIKVLSPKQFA